MATDTETSSTTPPPQPTTINQETWNQLLGNNNNWKTLLNPLDLNLRNLILRCGDFIQTTYDSFNNDQNSIYCGSSRYGKTSFFNKVMLENPTYTLHCCFFPLRYCMCIYLFLKLLFFTHYHVSWDRESNWIGYIQLVGHSLGASLSIVSAFDLVENGVTDVPVTAFVFGSPQVGNKAFNDRFKKFQNLKVLHARNVIDLIPHYPGKLLGYEYTATELVIDTRKSTSLKDSKNPSDWHNLQAMLHIVAGWNGSDGEFEVKVKRSLALVNKSCDYLKEECHVPASWWVATNKGMVCREDGEWVDAPEKEDLPVPEEY